MQNSDSLDIKENFQIAGSVKVHASDKYRIDYILHLADTVLILSQRNAEWCGHGPILEQDIAITNISLDLIGQARNFYQYAAQIINDTYKLEETKVPPAEGFREASEDSLAYLRKERDYKNLLLVEQSNGDWGQTILRQYLYSQFQYLLYEQLQQGPDEQLAAIAAKALKETAYHVRWSSEWVIRLGDGTNESNERMLKAIDELWRYTGEMFEMAPYETIVDVSLLKNEWLQKVSHIFSEASLPVLEKVFMQSGGKTGTHTEHLGFILAELQYMQRAYPGAEW